MAVANPTKRRQSCCVRDRRKGSCQRCCGWMRQPFVNQCRNTFRVGVKRRSTVSPRCASAQRKAATAGVRDWQAFCSAISPMVSGRLIRGCPWMAVVPMDTFCAALGVSALIALLREGALIPPLQRSPEFHSPAFCRPNRRRRFWQGTCAQRHRRPAGSPRTGWASGYAVAGKILFPQGGRQVIAYLDHLGGRPAGRDRRLHLSGRRRRCRAVAAPRRRHPVDRRRGEPARASRPLNAQSG